jgi:hypothetical protein
MCDSAFVVLPAQQHGDIGEIGRCLRRDALPRCGRPQPLVMQKAVAQQVPRLDGAQFRQRDHMLLRDRVGKIGVDPDLLHV